MNAERARAVAVPDKHSKMTIHRALGVRIAWILLAGACAPGSEALVEPPATALDAKNTGNMGMRATFVQGDYEPASGESLVLTGAGCTGVVERSYNVSFQGDDCLSLTTTTGVTLTDDAYFAFATKAGSINGVQFWIQDVVGPEGIGHDSDKMPVSPPQATSSQQFVVHVHARNVPVWRLSGHLSKKRVAQVGTVSIGDVVFYTP